MFQNKVRRKIQDRNLAMPHDQNVALKNQKIYIERESINLANLCGNNK